MKRNMSDRWGNLRDRFKKKNIDLDAEFEKFLNEVGKTKKTMLICTPLISSRELPKLLKHFFYLYVNLLCFSVHDKFTCSNRHDEEP